MIIFALSALQTLNPTQNFRHRADKILRNIGIFSALLIQAARQRHIAHDGNAFLFSGADHALRFLRLFPLDDSFPRLSEALGRGDVQAAFRAAHTLKGVAANLGLERLRALARELADGRSTEEAIVFANMASALAVSRVGAQDSIPSYEEVLDFKKRME
mgnify:CR=1 FL=1